MANKAATMPATMAPPANTGIAHQAATAKKIAIDATTTAILFLLLTTPPNASRRGAVYGVPLA